MKNKKTNKIDRKQLEDIVITKRLRTQINRRIEVAELLIAGKSYNDICDQLTCSTAFVAAIAKKLKAHGLLK